MGIWNATSHGNHFYGTSTLSFAPGATITVDMGERTVELNDQLTGKAAFQAAGDRDVRKIVIVISRTTF